MERPMRDWPTLWSALMRDVPGWSARPLRAIGEQAGCNPGTASRVRRGVGEVAPETVVRVLVAAGASPDVVRSAQALLGVAP